MAYEVVWWTFTSRCNLSCQCCDIRISDDGALQMTLRISSLNTVVLWKQWGQLLLKSVHTLEVKFDCQIAPLEALPLVMRSASLTSLRVCEPIRISVSSFVFFFEGLREVSVDSCQSYQIFLVFLCILRCGIASQLASVAARVVLHWSCLQAQLVYIGLNWCSCIYLF